MSIRRQPAGPAARSLLAFALVLAVVCLATTSPAAALPTDEPTTSSSSNILSTFSKYRSLRSLEPQESLSRVPETRVRGCDLPGETRIRPNRRLKEELIRVCALVYDGSHRTAPLGSTGLYYLRHRVYDPSLGRFLSRDPIGFQGGLNLYAYVGNNPINARDPLGLWPDRRVSNLVVLGAAALGTLSALSPLAIYNMVVGAREGTDQVLNAKTPAEAINGGIKAATNTFYLGAPPMLSAGELLALRQGVSVSLQPPCGARGNASGREFDPAAAGGEIQKLNLDRIKITSRGADVVEQHLARFGEDAYNSNMIDRLRQITMGLRNPEAVDYRFYSHELREFVRYRNLGWSSGQPANADAAFDLWNNAHTATLEDYGLREGPGVLYHPSMDPWSP